MTFTTIQGACDLHLHSYPDIFPRILDDVDYAQICRDAGMRAIVLKCHADSTMGRAYHTMKQVKGIQVFGGIVLNHQAGGINPAAVDVALQLGAVQVWMPTYHSQAHFLETGLLGAYSHQGTGRHDYDLQGITILDEMGGLIPEVYQILELVKKHNAIIGTGHLSVRESLALISAAREIGCQRVVMTHPFYSPPSCSIKDIKKAVELGAFIEFCAGNPLNPLPKQIDMRLYVECIEQMGSDSFIISSDCGHPRKTAPPETIRMFIQTLNYMGVSERHIWPMIKDNYDYLLDLGNGGETEEHAAVAESEVI